MRIRGILFAFIFAIVMVGCSNSDTSYAGKTYSGKFVKGIYVTQNTAENRKRLLYLIKQSKAVGIDTFVVDIWKPSKRLAKNIPLLKENGIRYVARVVVFPRGGTREQLANRALWEKRWKQAKYAISLGAQEIQLDYIRYKPSNIKSTDNAKRVLKVIKFFRNKLKGTGVKLQIDVFGISAIKPSLRIGHDVKLFAETVDAINPMVYPSHYEPYRQHAVTPYKTVFESVEALKEKITHAPHVRVYAYIELYNYRYPMSYATKQKYILAQLKAARKAGAHGWYAWSPGNKYKILFKVLRNHGG